MSAIPTPNVERTIEHCRPQDVTPVTVDAAGIESTAPGYLRDLKRDLTAEGYYPAGISLAVSFDAECSLRTQEEAERVREYVRAAAFIGAGTVSVSVEEAAAPEKVRSALAACEERARREGVALEIDGSVTLDD